ncbi:hypothetical protein RRG08_018169 [Elysia crispata]|uniref:Uncharacterized protein n=1 Tax=Elysia crispata TaxID=231223 RepID=A0AAE1DX66_9GAST|nr:hypothetical protein RRG08_018169 [Elysia crispata]
MILSTPTVIGPNDVRRRFFEWSSSRLAPIPRVQILLDIKSEWSGQRCSHNYVDDDKDGGARGHHSGRANDQ